MSLGRAPKQRLHRRSPSRHMNCSHQHTRQEAPSRTQKQLRMHGRLLASMTQDTARRRRRRAAPGGRGRSPPSTRATAARASRSRRRSIPSTRPAPAASPGTCTRSRPRTPGRDSAAGARCRMSPERRRSWSHRSIRAPSSFQRPYCSCLCSSTTPTSAARTSTSQCTAPPAARLRTRLGRRPPDRTCRCAAEILATRRGAIAPGLKVPPALLATNTRFDRGWLIPVLALIVRVVAPDLPESLASAARRRARTPLVHPPKATAEYRARFLLGDCSALILGNCRAVTSLLPRPVA